MATNQASGLNVIALISGGKDSFYSILHCIRNGHRIVALANLHPPLPPAQGNGTDNQEEDMDSFMYQTIGHRVIPLYEQALRLPLYRAPITGGAVDTSRIYGDEPVSSERDGDETESLVPLLKRIMKDHPEADAVSAGAILSTYQRTRIENVASRLGLVPLAWLWMYPSLPPPVEREGRPTHAGLLEDMAAAGCDSRIIKVSSGGLDSSFLWENVADPNGRTRDRMVRVMKRFVVEGLSGAVLGEGGEYETLAIDGPGFLWKNRISIEQEDREVKTGDGGVSFLSLSRATVVPKDMGESCMDPQYIRRPQRLDPLFARALHDLDAGLEKESTEAQITTSEPFMQERVGLTQSGDGNILTISNVADPEAGTGADEQMRGIVAKLRTILGSSSEKSSPTTTDIVFATVLLRSMRYFAQVNGEYVSLFTKPNPPARVTVACGDYLPEGVQVMASFVIDRGPRSRREGLHVQSRSYWAPANIGPYSQAISIPLQEDSSLEHAGGLVFVAGQIPLDPASMEIADGHKAADDAWDSNFSLHATLALQHLWRIGTATKVDWWLGGVAFLASDPQRGHVKARIATDLWKTMNCKQLGDDNTDEDGPDAWDIRYGGQGDLLHAATQEHQIPNYDVVDCPTQSPPIFTVEVQELPRGSDIEWQGIGLRGNISLSSRTLSELSATVWSTVTGDGIAFYSIEIGLEGINSALVLHSRIEQILTHLDGGRMVHFTVYTTYNLSGTTFKGQIIPCQAIWGSQGQRIAAVMMLRSTQKE